MQSYKLKTVGLLEQLGHFTVFVLDVMRWTFRRPLRLRLFAIQVEHMGVGSVPIIVLSGFATGMIMSLQMINVLSFYNTEAFAGAGVGITLARELAPIMTALMLIAKNGSAITAEIGTMRISEQIDAMETMSVNPVQYLAVPRVWAAVVVFPILTALSNVVGVAGSYLVSIHMRGVDRASYLHYLFSLVDPPDFMAGIIKATVMGMIVALISCFYGFNVRGGAKAVGDAATRSVVASSVSILVADYIMATVLLRVLV
jgi:phospholipid/cholesterol/gamma-HCH transport system permease protein